MKILVLRISIVDDAANITLEKRIENLCTVQSVAGFKLMTAFAIDGTIVLIFQKP